MRYTLTTGLTLALTVGSLGLPPLPARARPAQQRLDTGALNAIEDLSESLANDLLALSVAVRDKDRSAIVQYFADPIVATPLPTDPRESVPEIKWVLTHGWGYAGMNHDGYVNEEDPRPLRRDDFLAGLEMLLEHFPSIEDVRFKVKGAEFGTDAAAGSSLRGTKELHGPNLLDEAHSAPQGTAAALASPRGSARVFIYIVGRDPEGRREWLQAWSRVEARRDEPPRIEAAGTEVSDDEEQEPWKIHRFQLESIESMVAQRELFSEVALPAGVHAAFPAFGTAPNDTVVAHGAAVADVNDDGLVDVVTTGVEQNRLFVNDGNGGFRDVSVDSLVGVAPAGTGPLFVDYDNDGDPDLFFAAVGNQVLLENRFIPDRELKFFDRSLEAGVAVPATGFSAAAADVNRDGFQDIYVASYNRYGIVMPNSWDRATNGTPNLLFVNQRDGTFREMAEAWGVQESRWSYAAGFADIDEDGDQDLYVANDFGENGLFLNDGDRFREAAEERGVIDPGNGMGVAFGDYDNDGDLDLHVTNMSSTAGNRILARLYPDAKPEDLVLKKLAAGNSLYENDGAGNFRDVTAEVGGFSAGWAFGGGFIDLDNDGWEDVYSPNGFISGKTMNDT